MKILVVVPYFDEPHRWMISGQKTAFELSKNHQVVVFTTGPETIIDERSPSLKLYRYKDIFLKDPVNFSIIPGLSRKIRAVVAAEKPDAVVINKHMFYTSLAIWPLKRLGLPVIVQTDTFPGINWFPKSAFVKLVMWWYARLIGNPILRKADLVVLLYDELLPLAKELKFKGKVIHNGVDIPVLDAAAKPADLTKKPGDIWVGYIGRLETVKGWYDLAAVAKKLVAAHKNYHFFFAGLTDNAKDQIAEFNHPNIHFLGLRKDVAGINKLLDIFVMPSLSEGLSNALMEAMAIGPACIASNVGGNKFLVENEKTGLLFEPRDQAGLEQQIVRLASDPSLRKKLAAAARQKIETKFSLTASINELAEILQDMVKTKRR